jgi:ribonuclease VapC
MVIDASAVLAILLSEKDAGRFAEAIQNAEARRMSAVNYLEAALVIDNRGDAMARREFDGFLRRAEIVIEPVTHQQAQIAREAYRDFGKGRHRAGLNFGDCISCALAKVFDEQLLYKGDDFSQTDIRSALET